MGRMELQRQAVRAIPLRVSVAAGPEAFRMVRHVHDALAARRRRVLARAGVATVHGAFRSRTAAEVLLRHVGRAGPQDALVTEAPEDLAEAAELNRDAVQAQALLVPGVAHDPADGRWAPDPERARAVAATLPPLATLVSGEAHPILKAALREGAREAGGFFLDAAPRMPRPPPGLPQVTVLDRFLRIRTGGGLLPAEKVALLSAMERRLQWVPSALAGLRLHEGTGLRPGEVRPVLDHLLRRWPARVAVLAAYGAASAADAAALVPVLDRAMADGVVARAYVAGPGAQPIGRRLAGRHAVTVANPRPRSLPALLRLLHSECAGGALLVVGDGGEPWLREALARLRLPGLRRGHWAPWGAEAADLPARVGPRPEPPAPGFGRRAQANILGDAPSAPAARRTASEGFVA